MKRKINQYIKTWEQRCYSEGIPDEAPDRLEVLNKVPSYRKIATCILKNDYQLKGLGLTIQVSNYYHELKRIELKERNLDKQLKIF